MRTAIKSRSPWIRKAGWKSLWGALETLAQQAFRRHRRDCSPASARLLSRRRRDCYPARGGFSRGLSPSAHSKYASNTRRARFRGAWQVLLWMTLWASGATPIPPHDTYVIENKGVQNNATAIPRDCYPTQQPRSAKTRVPSPGGGHCTRYFEPFAAAAAASVGVGLRRLNVTLPRLSKCSSRKIPCSRTSAAASSKAARKSRCRL